MTAPITTEELRNMAEGRRVFSHNDGLTLAAELITARAKLEAAEKLAEAVAWIKKNRSFCDIPSIEGHWDDMSDAALAAWETVK